MKISLKFVLVLAAVLICLLPGSADAQKREQQQAVEPAARQAIIYGQIASMDPKRIVIKNFGRRIKVDMSDLIKRGPGRLDDYYDEGMFVTVEGTLTDEDEITASRLSQGQRYLYLPPRDNNSGVLMLRDLY